MDVCIVKAESSKAALASARAVCGRMGPARVVLIPDTIEIGPDALGRRIPPEQVEPLYEGIQQQLAGPRRHSRAR